MQTFNVVGIDVSKKTIDIYCLPCGASGTFPNNVKGFSKMCNWLTDRKIAIADCWLVFEHTGMYSIPLSRYCSAKQIKYTLVPGLALKRSLGISRGKSDHIDARRIASYAMEKQHSLVASKMYDETIEKLKRLICLRNKLIVDRAGLKQRNEQMQQFCQIKANDIEIKVQKKIVKLLDSQILEVEQAIKALIDQNSDLSKSYHLLVSIKGVGFIVAANLIAYTANFTRFSDARKFACYIGTAPFEHTSGTSIKGKSRVSYFAYKKLKVLIDLAAKSAIKSDPELKSYYQHRIEAGKSKMSTINVVRNKILTRVFAVIKRETPYQIKNMAA